MTDLDDLHSTLRDPPDFTPQSLDLDQIMSAGGRLRRRRRLVHSAAATLVAIVLIAGGTQIADMVHRPGHISTATAARVSCVGVSLGADSVGAVVGTGLTSTEGRHWVIYGVHLGDSQMPLVTFGFMIGDCSDHGSAITPYTIINDVTGSETAPGFHGYAVARTLENGSKQPAFGYYVGTPARITATADGHTATATMAIWSYNPAITIFWFDTSQVTGATPLTNLTATATDGRKLSIGDTSGVIG
jgi:hypothetical protein